MTITKLLCPSCGKGKLLAPELPNFLLRGENVVQTNNKVSFKECHEAHQAHQRNVLNATMSAVGTENPFFSLKCQNWSNLAKIHRPNFVIPPPPP